MLAWFNRPGHRVTLWLAAFGSNPMIHNELWQNQPEQSVTRL
jgi:hypothetical protein